MHWCADETLALLAAIPAFRFALSFALGIIRRVVG